MFEKIEDSGAASQIASSQTVGQCRRRSHIRCGSALAIARAWEEVPNDVFSHARLNRQARSPDSHERSRDLRGCEMRPVRVVVEGPDADTWNTTRIGPT